LIIGGSGQPATFHLTRYPGCSSLLTPDPKVIDMFMTIGCVEPGGNFHVQKTEIVETVRMSARPRQFLAGDAWFAATGRRRL
jgi:hypothetical protein